MKHVKYKGGVTKKGRIQWKGKSGHCYHFYYHFKGYFRYKTITYRNVSSGAQVKNFFILWKSDFLFSRYSSFCIFNHLMIYQICDVMMSGDVAYLYQTNKGSSIYGIHKKWLIFYHPLHLHHPPKWTRDLYFETIESANTQQSSRHRPLPFCVDVINAWPLRSSIKFVLLICATTIMKPSPRSVLKNRYFANSCPTLVIMKVQKTPAEEIIFSELRLPQSTSLLKSEHLHRYFSKFRTISKEQWSYLEISRIAWEKEGEGEVGWAKFIHGGYYRGGITYRRRDDTPLSTMTLSLQLL